jgi:hypothetical protein
VSGWRNGGLSLHLPWQAPKTAEAEPHKGRPQHVTFLLSKLGTTQNLREMWLKKGVCSSALKENEVEVSGPPPRKVKRLELNFSGDEEDFVSDL